MKTKKLTKDQIEERALRRKHLVRFALITSLIVNLFFIIVAIIGCSSVKSQENKSNNSPQLKLNKQRNYASRDNLDYFNGSFGYGLKYNDELVAPSKISIGTQATYNVSLGSNLAVVVRTSNDSSKTLDETWTCIYNIHHPSVNGDYIRFETPNWTRTYAADVVNDTWTITVISPEDYLYDQIYLPPSLDYNAENYQTFRVLMSYYFKELSFDDYELNRTWSLFDYVSGTCVTNYNDYSTLSGYIVNNAVYGSSLPILSHTLFSLNGQLYTDLFFHVQRLTDPDIFNYVYSYSDPQESRILGNVYFPDFAYAYNASSERTVRIWSVPYEEQAGNVFHIYSFERGFLNDRYNQIRLFDRHLSNQTLPGFTNSNSLLANGVILGSGYSNENLENVFDLIAMSFTSLQGLFSVTILPGITIGILFFIPLIAIVVFSLIKIIHK